MQNESQIQLGQDGRLRHLLTLEDLNKNIIENILHTAKRFVSSKKISEKEKEIFQSSTVANLFFEPSTRTRGSFEIASKLLGCNSINIDIKNSYFISDTLKDLEVSQKIKIHTVLVSTGYGKKQDNRSNTGHLKEKNLFQAVQNILSKDKV